MSNQIEKLQFTEMTQMGKVFAESGMFVDAKSAAQAIVKIQAGQEIGISPFSAMSGIHIIQGKPAIGAGLMAATVKGSGKYDYKVVSMDEAKCSIDFYQGKEKIGNSSFTIDEAKKAGTKNLDKFPKNMLFARAMSNGVKWFTPDVFNGSVYTPEELSSDNNFTVETTAEVVETKPTIIGKKKLSEAKYKQALESVRKGENLPNSEVSFYTFLINDCELTEAQLAEVELASQPM